MRGLINIKDIKEKKSIKNKNILKTIGLKKKTEAREDSGFHKRRGNGLDKKKMKERGWNDNKERDSNKNKGSKEKEEDRRRDK